MRVLTPWYVQNVSAEGRGSAASRMAACNPARHESLRALMYKLVLHPQGALKHTLVRHPELATVVHHGKAPFLIIITITSSIVFQATHQRIRELVTL